MSVQIQFRRGTTAEHSSFTGAVGEVTVNTTSKSLHVHDGVTQTGHEVARADLANHHNVGVLTAVTFSGNLSGNATGLTGNPNITVNNATVNGVLSVGGTTVILNATTLQINDRDITLGITTDAFGNNLANDITANHGGIAIASTVGSPIINIPIDSVNDDLATYKQIMWIKEGHYSGMGTDAWVFNYGVSIGNTQSIKFGSRLTVGAGFTVYDSYIDTLDIRTKNINCTGITTSSGGFSGNLTGTATSTTNIPNLTGDVTSVNTLTTLATVNSNVGTFGSGGAIPTITVNAKGLITGVTTTAINAANDGTLNLQTSGTGLSGSATFTANQSGISTFTVSSNATNANTGSTLVARDGGGGFVAGIITATDFNSTSDFNLKDNIQTLENALDVVKNIRGVKFEWKENHKQSVGVIAQEVEKVLPQLVTTSETKTVNYNGLVGVLIESVKELKLENDLLKLEISKIKSHLQIDL